MSKICHRNEKPSATGLFTKGQNLVADGQTSLCYIDFVVNHVLIRNNMNPARATSFFRTNIHNIHRDGSILCQALTFFFNDRGNPSPSPSTTNTDSLPESLQFSEDGSMPASTPSFSRRASSSAENKKAQDRWSKEEEKLLVQTVG